MMSLNRSMMIYCVIVFPFAWCGLQVSPVVSQQVDNYRNDSKIVSDRQKLQGKWRVIKYKQPTGTVYLETTPVLEIREDKMVWTANDQQHQLPFRIEPGGQFSQIEFVIGTPYGFVGFHGIYRLRCSTLEISMATMSDPLPTMFEPKSDSKFGVVVLSRSSK